MSLEKVFRYQDVPLKIRPRLINDYVHGYLPRHELTRSLSICLNADPFTAIEVLNYLDNFRKLMSFVCQEKNEWRCDFCKGKDIFVLCETSDYNPRQTYWELKVQCMDCTAELQQRELDYDTEMY